MDLSSRYEILDTIASGDFATVLRARDRELGREVAIKQIHQQFLADQQQLARYWREAQLLASLQHPNILTIYDIVRPRGWLILELMQGNLKQRAQGEPLDLDSLRTVLAAGLSALQFLHTNGVIHGDVKPGNLLFDAQNRIKLGDFGLARRASSEEGSLLKGTTKYMAPELVSGQFGEVGPASDLYSLGFSAFELMCGSRFESLFPGLASFGRDKQIAWMMWHAAADRNLPEIGRVLEGVPDDLARVIQKLVAKDQARRYRSAKEVLRDLASAPPVIDQPPEEEDPRAVAARTAAARKKRRIRLLAALALGLSLMLCVVMFLPEDQQVPPPLPRGVVTRVFPNELKLALEPDDGGKPQELSFNRYARFFVNGEPARLNDLKRDDQVIVRRVRDQALGRWVFEVYATRPKTYSGRIKEIRADEEPFGLRVAQSDEEAEDLIVEIPEDAAIVLNPGCDQRPIAPAELRPEDRVVVRHVARETRRAAIELSVQRQETLEGTLADRFNKTQQQLTLTVAREGQARLLYLPVAANCRVTINGQSLVNRKALTAADLREGDEAVVVHDVQVRQVDVQRTLRQSGEIHAVHYSPGTLQAQTFDVTLEGSTEPVTCRLAPTCTITLAGEPATLADLRKGDRVEIAHASLDGKDIEAEEIAAGRPTEPTRWAILIGIENYGRDASLGSLAHATADAGLLHGVLTRRYQIPAGQARLITDKTLKDLRADISRWLSKIDSNGSLIFYFAGHAYQDDQQAVYLAPADFQLSRMTATGLPLQWLVDELEKCPAEEKLLLLDCSHAPSASGNDLKRQPSTAEMLRTLEGPPGWAPLRTVNALASCSTGQRGHVWEEKGQGLFAWCLARGYEGNADKDRDKRVDPKELFAFVQQQMASLNKQLGIAQTPTLLEADNRPPRLDEEAKEAIFMLAEYLRHKRIDLDAVNQQFAAAAEAAGAEPEPKLLLGLLLLKARQRQPAREQFAELQSRHPDWLIPMQGTALIWFEERGHMAGMSELQDLVAEIPGLPSAAEEYPSHIAKLLTWIGQLRQFAEIAAEKGFRVPPQSLAAIDAAVAAHGKPAQTLYDLGRQQSRDRKLQLEEQAETAKREGNVATATQLLTVERYLLHNYVTFPFDDVLKQIAGELDQRQPRY